MANEQMNEKITAALAKLDPANNDHWTDEGFPKTGVVQRFANDQSIKRQDIQAAAPDFVRPAVKTDDPFDDGPVEHTGTEESGAPADAAQEGNGGIADSEADNDFISEDDLKLLLQQRVEDYDNALKAARAKQAEGAKEEVQALKDLNEAKRELNAKFPPKTAAENIKEYLASEQAKRAAAHGHGMARVDQAMARGNSRGWRRPVRGVVGADGNLMKNPDGTVATPRPMQVRPRPVLPSTGRPA
jgi:hypothetical protein